MAEQAGTWLSPQFLGSTVTSRSFVPTCARHAAARRDSQGWPKATAKRRASVLCAGHVQQPGGESPLCNLMEVKHE